MCQEKTKCSELAADKTADPREVLVADPCQEESDVSLAREVPEGSLQGAPGMSADEDELYDAAESGDKDKVRELVAQGPALRLLL